MILRVPLNEVKRERKHTVKQKRQFRATGIASLYLLPVNAVSERLQLSASRRAQRDGICTTKHITGVGKSERAKLTSCRFKDPTAFWQGLIVKSGPTKTECWRKSVVLFRFEEHLAASFDVPSPSHL